MSTFAGVEPCPQCGAGLLPDNKCESCGYDPRPPRECINCGWVENSRCKNCGATLSDNHIVRKQMPDDWLWLTCAYCGWPITAYIYRSLELEPYIEPPEDDDYDYGTGHGSIIGSVFAFVVVIFVIAALFGPISQLTTGISPNATGFTRNGNITSTPAFGALINLFPFLFVIVGILIVASFFGKIRV